MSTHVITADETLTIRTLRHDDAESVVSLYAACGTIDPHIPTLSASRWTADIGRPQFAEGRDFLVAASDETMIGLAESSLHDQGSRRTRLLRLLVHPRRRRCGIGVALLKAVLDQGPADPSVLLQSLIPSEWTAGLAFARRFGFERTESELKMRCSALRSAPDAPPDVIMTRADDGDAQAEGIAAVHNEAFADDAGFCRLTADDMKRNLGDMDLWTARASGKIIGYALIEPDADGGLLDTLAVMPEARGRGIGTALAFRSLSALRIGDDRTADLGVSSLNPRARRIYERLGFALRYEVGRYATPRDDLLKRLPRGVTAPARFPA